MRRLVLGASIVAFGLACSSHQTNVFKKSPQQENFMVGGKIFTLSNFKETHAFNNGNRLLEHADEKGIVTIILLDKSGKQLETGTLLKKGGAKDAFFLVFEASDGRIMELTRRGFAILRPLETPSDPIENLNIR